VKRIIAVANQKGGVGKTTTVFNLGWALAQLGKRVLLVDLDPQAALTMSCGQDPYQVTRSLYTVLLRDTRLVSVLRQVAPNLYLAPATSDLARAEIALSTFPDRAFRLSNALQRLALDVDFVLMDTPPSLGLLTVNAMTAAQELLIPVQCQFLSMRGVRALLEMVWRIHERMNPSLALLGILPTMYRPEVEHSQAVLAELQDVFQNKVFSAIIVDQPSVAEAPVSAQSVLTFDPDSPAAQAYRTLAQEIIHGK